MSKDIGDIDIDVKSHTDKDKYGTRAIIYHEDKQTIVPHPSGYYIDNNVPVDPESGMSTLDYKTMEALGFVKVDLLTNTTYDLFRSKEDVLKSIQKEPDWRLLQNERFVLKLPHLAGNYELLCRLQPDSIEVLADILALIRPAKIKYIEDYIIDKDRVRKNLYKRAKTGYYIKKSHAYAYAHMIVCTMNQKNVGGLLTYEQTPKISNAVA